MTKFQNSKISALLNSNEFMVSMCCKTRSLLLSHTLSFQNLPLPCPHLQKMYGSLQTEFSFPSIPSLYFIPTVQNLKNPTLLPSSKSYQNQNKNTNINQIRASKEVLSHSLATTYNVEINLNFTLFQIHENQSRRSLQYMDGSNKRTYRTSFGVIVHYEFPLKIIIGEASKPYSQISITSCLLIFPFLLDPSI